MMNFNEINGISVGADLSRTAPIYRPSLAFSDISQILLHFIIGFWWFSLSPFHWLNFNYKKSA